VLNIRLSKTKGRAVILWITKFIPNCIYQDTKEFMGNAGKAMFPTPWKIHELFTITHYVDWLIVPSTTTFNVEPKFMIMQVKKDFI